MQSQKTDSARILQAHGLLRLTVRAVCAAV
nr:MAG TPA: hypothetical protein [Caudoviricetes sp.]